MGVVLLLMAVGVLVMSVGASKCIDGEREVLLEFKRSIVDEEDNLGSWGNHREDCCSGWAGVGCDNLTGHVIEIDLFGMDLLAKGGRFTSSLPFVELRYLKYLNLNGNVNLLANQSISSLFGNNGSMVSLQYLGLFRTGIGGTIPENIGNIMPSLTDLFIVDNRLEGTIPEGLGNMAFLAHLDLSGNLLRGQIPKNFGENMTSLRHLNLGNNRLEGTIPRGLGNMALLTQLDISENLLGGLIPKSFGENMTGLTYLDLGYNRLEGTIPETFGKMVHLTLLSLYMNRLEGHIPEALGNMPALKELHLWYNKLEGEIPKFIWNICTLKHLRMESNRLNGSLVISTLCPNHPLRELKLDSNRLTGSFPNISMFPSMVELSVGGNLLDGVISEHHFATLSKLRTLNLSSSNFTFNLTSAWLPPFRLEMINLMSCNLGPEFPNWIRTQVNYKWLDIVKYPTPERFG
ncbi:unnamed protein product [Cuscuta epithymum]|uniref:Leucine-rich repeat-containing N-terminal plant-type domain-containing protein n=1 Tax=Cuscuta epithymum TaxID=186058 RepID=A0AAV0FBX0_9ASTE|nr:unnamed protein product [Cuscuta epithymum]